MLVLVEAAGVVLVESQVPHAPSVEAADPLVDEAQLPQVSLPSVEEAEALDDEPQAPQVSVDVEVAVAGSVVEEVQSDQVWLAPVLVEATAVLLPSHSPQAVELAEVVIVAVGYP